MGSSSLPKRPLHASSIRSSTSSPPRAGRRMVASGRCSRTVPCSPWIARPSSLSVASARVAQIRATRAEATLWLDGRAIQGLHGTVLEQRPDATIRRPARGGEEVELRIELACNGLFGRLDDPIEVERCDLVLVDEDAWRLYFDFEVLRQLELAEGLEP